MVLSFYVLHQTVIVIGYLIFGWDGDVLIKFLTLSAVSFVLILALYIMIHRSSDYQ